MRDLPHAVFHIDRGIIYNVNELFRRPGEAIRGYLAGKRKPFFHPASYLVIALILNFVVAKIYNLHFFDVGELEMMDPLAAKVIQDYDALQWWFLEHTYIYILFSIPASTLFLFGIFKLMKEPYNIAETAVVILFTIAQGVLIQTFIYLCFGWFKNGPFIRTVESINMSILITYATMVIWQLLNAVPNKVVRFIFALIGGAGLALVWIATAYLLYLALT